MNMLINKLLSLPEVRAKKGILGIGASAIKNKV